MWCSYIAIPVCENTEDSSSMVVGVMCSTAALAGDGW